MNNQRGRPPKKDSKTDQYRLRLNSEERAMLEYLSEKLETDMSDILRRGLKIQYNMAQFSD